MMILLRWLIGHAWIFYAACIFGIIIYIVRALIARRERDLALFTLEREAAATRAARAWVTVLILVAIGAAVFISTSVVLPSLPFYSLRSPLPTATLSAGVEPSTPGTPGATLTAIEPLSATWTPPRATASVPTPPPPDLTESPTPELTETPEGARSGDVHARFGNFAELVGYSVSGTEITTGEPLLLTLRWRALAEASPTSYQVFTHLMAGSGGTRLIAQHDSAPARGSRPTTGWIPGEAIVDTHPMEFKADSLDYVGPARIVVGLYDPETGRVTTQTGDDSVVLPVTMNVVAQ